MAAQGETMSPTEEHTLLPGRTQKAGVEADVLLGQGPVDILLQAAAQGGREERMGPSHLSPLWLLCLYQSPLDCSALSPLGPLL